MISITDHDHGPLRRSTRFIIQYFSRILHRCNNARFNYEESDNHMFCYNSLSKRKINIESVPRPNSLFIPVCLSDISSSSYHPSSFESLRFLSLSRDPQLSDSLRSHLLRNYCFIQISFQIQFLISDPTHLFTSLASHCNSRFPRFYLSSSFRFTFLSIQFNLQSSNSCYLISDFLI